MATIAETQALFRSYIDEPDSSFVTDADIKLYLERGYDEFRHKVMQIDPGIIQSYIGFGISGSYFYDLSDAASAARLLGATVTVNGVAASRLVQIIDLAIIRSMTAAAAYTAMPSAGSMSGMQPSPLNPVPNAEALAFSTNAYTLTGNMLSFSEKQTGTLAMQYVAESAIDWAVGGAGTFIDNLTMFHDIIPLLAYKQYAIRDGAINEPLERQLGARLMDMREYLQTRVQGGAQYVQSHLYGTN